MNPVFELKPPRGAVVLRVAEVVHKPHPVADGVDVVMRLLARKIEEMMREQHDPAWLTLTSFGPGGSCVGVQGTVVIMSELGLLDALQAAYVAGREARTYHNPMDRFGE